MTRPRPNRLSPLLVACALACSALPAARSQDLDRLKQNTDRWIEIRSRTAQEKALWDADKRLLGESIKTLESSRQAVEQRAAHFESEHRRLAEQTEAAQKTMEGFATANRFLTDHIRAYEERIQTLAQRLPQPLLDQLQPLLAKIPSEAERETVPAPNRLQNVVAIMTLIDEFNNQITLAHTIKTLDNGESIEVRVLYWGLAAAYASDGEGSRAWTLQPDANAWRWREADSDAALIKRLFDVYDKRIDPALVALPFQFAAQEAGQ